MEASTSQTPSRRADARRDDEKGYVIALSALLLIPMLVFTAFATDVGAWYVRGQEIQRAADAAALAAVVWMPDEDQAIDVALDVAARNGFVDQPGDFDDPNADLPQIQISQVGNQRVRVDIRAEGDLYFGSVVESFDEPEIHRYATAEYVLPVPMGNPTSALGTGNVGGSSELLWLAVNSYCSGRQQGDQILTRYQGPSWICDEGPYGSSSYTTANPQYDDDGYYLILDFPENSDAETWIVSFYDPGICDNPQEIHDTGRPGPRLDTTLYRADDTVLDDYDNVNPSNIVGSRTFSRSDCGGWNDAYTIQPTDRRGRYVLNYRSLADTDEYGMNYFGIRITPQSSPGTICSTASGAGLDTCPQISAREWLPIYIGRNDKFGNSMFSAGTAASFYLAEVSDVHAGKVLELTLFDPGEGMDNLQIIAPDLSRLPFTSSTIDRTENPTITRYWHFNTSTNNYEVRNLNDFLPSVNDTCYVGTTDSVTPSAGNYPCLDVTYSATDDGYQNRTVRIEVPIPADYTCGSDCWWRIRYQPGSNPTVTDRTVWAVRVTGDPVRLIE